MTDRPYRPSDLAERWQCSNEHIYELIRQRRLIAFRAGGKLLRISAQEVARWESGGSPTGSDPTGLESSEISPSPRGAMPKDATGSGSGRQAAKNKQEARSLRLLMQGRGKSLSPREPA